MTKIESILYLLQNLKLTIKIILVLRKKEQDVQCLCDNTDTDDDVEITSITTELQILRIVTINKYEIKLENGSSLLFGIFSINKNFPNKPIRIKTE
ncbi:MAG: hypothetical protein P1P85_05715 [Patescibacteria group bacterium]|nr:hypothetical protein [Patescibacteria group bacterium]